MSGDGEQRVGTLSPDTVRPGTLTALLQEIAGGEPAAGAPRERPFEPGAVVARFEIVRELGRGGFGVVYEARDRELGRSVALKAVFAGAREELRQERLWREAEAAARLSHPNIVALHDAGRSERGPYLVLELLRGRTLAERLRQGPLTTPEAVHIAVEIAKGVAHAHGQGVVHRDLKPGNVFLCEDGQLKVLDFGLAHAFGRRRQDGGTPAYMAPEQRERAPEDERTDVWAVGAMLFEMLAGRLPFAEGKRAAREAPVLEVSGAPALGAIVGRMLAPRPADRPRDGAEVLKALAAVERELGPPASGAGRVRVRRRPRLVLAALTAVGVAVGAGVAWLVVSRGPAAGTAPPSVAVLPFADMSPGKDQEYLSDGVAEEIISALTRVDGLQVVGRTSTFSFKGKTDDLREVGRKLGAGAVLEGSVRKAGSKVRVTAQLVSAANGYQLWSETYDRELTDVLALEDEIARAVVEALRLRLASASLAAPKARSAVAPEAYTTYLIGRQLLRRSNDADCKRAQKAFEKAIALDPGYAPAWVGRARATCHESQEDFDRAVAAVDRALALDPDLGEAYATRGSLRAWRWDWEGARTDFDRALRLGPGSVDVHISYLQDLLWPLGRLRVPEARRATELDPLHTGAWRIYGMACQLDGQLERALRAYDRSLEIEPTDIYALLGKVGVLLRLGRPAEALASAERSTSPGFRLQGIAYAAHSLGRAEESRRALEELVACCAETFAYQIAGAFAWRGEREKAFEWLERAYRQHDGGLVKLKVSHVFRDLRGDPRFAALLQKMNLPLD